MAKEVKTPARLLVRTLSVGEGQYAYKFESPIALSTRLIFDIPRFTNFYLQLIVAKLSSPSAFDYCNNEG